MTPLLIGLAVFSLFVVFCVRHFFVQLIALKLLIDVTIFLLSSVRNAEQRAENVQTAAALIATLGALIFFALMAAGIQRFSRSKKPDLEVRSD